MKKPIMLLTLSLCAVIGAGAWNVALARAESNEDGVSSSGLESSREGLKKQQEKLREAQQKASEAQREAAKQRAEAEKQKLEEERERLGDTKAAEAKKNVCKNRESSIKKIIERTATNGTHHYEMITKVYDNVKAFATKKNLDAAQFAAEFAAADQAATTAKAAIETARAAGDTFNCDVAAPKSAASVFLAAKKEQAAALKAYRDAVKELLVAVKSAVEKETETTSDNGGTN